MNARVKKKVLPIVRAVLISLICLVMLFFAYRASTDLYKKWDVLKDLESRTLISEGYNPTNFGTYFGRLNLGVAREVWATATNTEPLNDIRLFKPAYEAHVAERTDLTAAQKRAAKTDAQYQFDMLMVGFNNPDTDSALAEINGYESNFIMNCAYFVIALVALLIVFCLVDVKKPFNDFTPKEEKSSLGLSAYLSIVLCYLTLGLYGLVLFFKEKKSRYVRQAAVQSMVIGLVTVALYFTMTLMFTIFSYMFPPASIIIYMVKVVLIAASITFLGFSFIMALCNRAVRLPLVGNLAINSSHCDVM